ncbi:MAG: hypothetical protein O2967_23610 [Proteobacteria bacterium]|nr:hypothetical protein [Alphaproteobacteria bacterium]MDA1101952.1 hypothetical protein [Pseudomonadota bacterium]
MHTFDTIIVISIACCVGFIPAIFVKKDLVLAVGYFVASTSGAFIGSYLAVRYFPQSDKPGLLFGGIFGAALLAVGWHFARKNKDHDHC